MDLRSSLAAQQYAATRPATAPSKPEENSGLGNAVADFAKTVQSGEDAALATMTSGADPQSLVQALAQTELAVETAVTVRDKIVEAYQEILRMPV